MLTGRFAPHSGTLTLPPREDRRSLPATRLERCRAECQILLSNRAVWCDQHNETMNVDEMQLAGSAARGELRAATELVDRFYQPVYAFLRRLTGGESDAADLTQKTFTRVWSALPRFAGRSTLSSWLHGIACHVWQDWRRANHRLEPRSDAWWAELPDHRTGPDVAVAAADLAATVYAAVDQLEPEARQAVHLHYYQGLTLEETSEALGVPTSTLKYRLRTAVQELRSRVTGKPRAAQTLNLVQRP